MGLTLPIVAALALLASPALADTVSPVQADPTYDYEADAGALLAQLQGYRPELGFELTFARAVVYELRIPTEELEGVRGERAVPAVLSIRDVGPGAVAIDPAHGLDLLVLTDPHGLRLSALPVGVPKDPAKFVVGLEDLAARALDVHSTDPRDLELTSGITTTVGGAVTQDPVHAGASGDLLAILAHGPVSVVSGGASDPYELGRELGGERILLIDAEDAELSIRGEGVTAVLRLPTASAAAGLRLVADAAGQPLAVDHEGGVQTSPEGIALRQQASILGSLLGEGVPGSAPAGSPEGASLSPMDASTAAAGAAMGGVAALVALGLAGAAAWGKYGLFTLLAPLYARLQHDEVLTNGCREAMYRHIMDNPGVNVSEMVKLFGLGWGATVYHLRVLERNHLIVAHKHGRQVCYFQNGGRYTGQMQGISVLRNANAAAIARAVLAQPGAQQREICATTGLAQPTASWHLQRLEASGLLLAQGGARKHYHASPSLEALAQRGLVPGYAAGAPAPIISTVRASAPAPTSAMRV